MQNVGVRFVHELHTSSQSDTLILHFDIYVLHYFSSNTNVMWLVRLRMGVARPCARGMERLNMGPASTVRE